jgi:hypothetical protein
LLGPRPAQRNVRLIVFRAFLVLVFLGLVAQLWRLQMVRGVYYQQAADVNRFRLTTDPAPRGVIMTGADICRSEPAAYRGFCHPRIFVLRRIGTTRLLVRSAS